MSLNLASVNSDVDNNVLVISNVTRYYEDKQLSRIVCTFTDYLENMYRIFRKQG